MECGGSDRSILLLTCQRGAIYRNGITNDQGFGSLSVVPFSSYGRTPRLERSIDVFQIYSFDARGHKAPRATTPKIRSFPSVILVSGTRSLALKSVIVRNIEVDQKAKRTLSRACNAIS